MITEIKEPDNNILVKIRRYKLKYCLNDVVTECLLSKNPKEYIKKIEPKILHNNEYYVTKETLINMLGRAKAVKSKNLLTELECKTQNKTIKNNIKEEHLIESTCARILENKIDFSNNLLQFNNNSIKYFYHNDNIYLKAKDVALMLGYIDSNDAIQKHVNKKNKFTVEYFLGVGDPPTPSRMNPPTEINSLLRNEDKQTLYINECGLYTLIFSSKMEQAELFTDWVTSEVLPSIRKNGYYKYESLEDYKDKDVVYILHIKDFLYKYGYSSQVEIRLNNHKRIIDYNKVIKIYVCNNINECLNLENFIKDLAKKLNINTTYNNYTEVFEINNIDNIIKNVNDYYQQIINFNNDKIKTLKLENLTLIEIERTKQAELEYFKVIKQVELEYLKTLNQLELEKEKTRQLELSIDLNKIKMITNNEDQIPSTKSLVIEEQQIQISVKHDNIKELIPELHVANINIVKPDQNKVIKLTKAYRKLLIDEIESVDGKINLFDKWYYHNYKKFNADRFKLNHIYNLIKEYVLKNNISLEFTKECIKKYLNKYNKNIIIKINNSNTETFYLFNSLNRIEKELMIYNDKYYRYVNNIIL
jgi:prophage antirepressor-like protein